MLRPSAPACAGDCHNPLSLAADFPALPRWLVAFPSPDDSAEGIGPGTQLDYITCSHAGLRVFDRWAFKVSESVYGSLRDLPPIAL